MKTLRPYKHKQLEFFMADNISIYTFRNEVASMEHPFFALKTGDSKIRKYKNGCVKLIVKSLADLGLATIFDKDIWIYTISKLQEALNNNKKISRKITFTPYDFFITTNRNTGGRAYEDLRKALSRLKGTVIQTNITYSEKKQEIAEFGLIDSWKIIEKKRGSLDIGMVEIILPDWFYQSLYKNKILKISPDYFRIRKAIDRRLYEIARKHCGSQCEFLISLEKLYLKTGSSSNKREFKRLVKNLCSTNDLPDYKVIYDNKTDNIIFVNRSSKKKSKLYFNKIEDYNLKTPEGFK